MRVAILNLKIGSDIWLVNRAQKRRRDSRIVKRKKALDWFQSRIVYAWHIKVAIKASMSADRIFESRFIYTENMRKEVGKWERNPMKILCESQLIFRVFWSVLLYFGNYKAWKSQKLNYALPFFWPALLLFFRISYRKCCTNHQLFRSIVYSSLDNTYG